MKGAASEKILHLFRVTVSGTEKEVFFVLVGQQHQAPVKIKALLKIYDQTLQNVFNGGFLADALGNGVGQQGIVVIVLYLLKQRP
jgi:hypothetical protein